MDNEVWKCTDNLINAIKNGNDFREYHRCRGVLEQYPGMLERIMDLRKQTIELYNTEDEEELSAGTESLDSQYEELQKIPEVNAFLESEEAIVRLLQNVSGAVTEAMGLTTPDM